MVTTDRGLLLVVSSPSGAGKTTLCRRLQQEFPALAFSVSYTTRPPRSGEHAGHDYHFVSPEKFQAMVAAGRFAEWAEVHGERYGTDREPLGLAVAGGRDVLFDVDWQGARALRAAFPIDTVLVFVLPPSLGELEGRLRGRGTDQPDIVARRLARAGSELSCFTSYDFLVINDDVDCAYQELRAVYVAARCAQLRRAPFARTLVAQLEPPGAS
ncbi:MAG: guanylate kinase [Proteobacteria bacterium]|nr:guanylate kinase [Pseudomonadota bacterium]